MHDLRPHAGTGGKVQLTRNRPSESILNGYVLAASERLALVHPFDDFEPDGYTVVRTADVTRVRRSPYERFWDRMLAAEGLLGGLDNPPVVDLTDMPSAIRSIALRHTLMSIQCEDKEENVEDFYIGTLVSAGPELVRFRHFDGLGRWDPDIAEIETREITLVSFANPYIIRFSRHIQEP